MNGPLNVQGLQQALQISKVGEPVRKSTLLAVVLMI